MKVVFFDIDKNKEILFDNNNIFNYEHFILEKYTTKIKKLSGVILIIENKILLVKPKKFKGVGHRWSIPKGRIPKNMSKKENAIIELKEETGIELNINKLNKSDKLKIFYKKSGQIKELNAYIVKSDLDQLNINITDNWEVDNEYFNKSEIYKAKFFDKNEALQKLEIGQLPILRIL